MTRALHLRFDGLHGPVLLSGCEALLPSIDAILPRWLMTVAPALDGVEPVASIRAAGPDRFEIATLSEDGGLQTFRSYDAVDTVCDMIVELSWELVRSGSWLMCLHAAAVEIAGRLVIFPSARRAGKSTLTACLARRGFRVFSDDFFPVSLSAAGHLQGHATGISPRLRLPLPAGSSAGFREWVAAHRGPGNRRYQYLALAGDQPVFGAPCPLGAVVLLDRVSTPQPPVLVPADTAAAVEGLLFQNFARSVHSGTILQSAAGLFRAIPPQRLTYSSAEEAADFLADAFAAWPAPPVAMAHAPEFRRVADTDLGTARPSFDPKVAYRRARGVNETDLDGARYLADASGLGIQRLNDGALAVWRLIEEPMRVDEICDVLAEAFPQVPRERLLADSHAALREFVERRLATPCARQEDGASPVAARRRGG
ncbi:MAG: PqqD family peptide modification chaperone [Rhodobacteraceae bacterium]|nr:PqqD family peptide modification chaperone [Paracoccaceae bacterium]